MRKYILYTVQLVSFVLVVGCATYYQKNIAFQQYFLKGEIENANSTLDKNKKAEKNKDKLLYFLQKGTVLQMLDDYEESNDYFERAYFFTEDYRKSYTKEFASILTNPSIKPYTGEDHELVLLHYFKAINYLQLNMYDEALVECRRLNDKTNLLNDRYEKKKNRYKKDAFALNLMGLIYEASGDINNAFIAYRNAYEVYEDNYKTYFNTEVPNQLKKDLLRTAYLNGFYDEQKEYENKFGFKLDYAKKPDAELLFFWHNGLGPVKDEWSINFLIVKGQGGIVMFTNEELGLSFPFPLPPMGQGSGGFGDLKFIRVAFPRYLERKPYFKSGEIIVNNTKYSLELAENINEIAFKTLEDRMLREFSNSLIRLAIKQATEQQVRQQNQNLGALLSVVNSVSEKADTRNWQTLPYSISYARIPLNEGENQINLHTYSPYKKNNSKQTFNINADKEQTYFQVFHSLESIPIELY